LDVRLEDLPVLINGDDILFRADDELYGYWLEEIEKLGFRLSLGKNYVHSKYLTVNSEMYRYEAESETFHFIKYLNAGLLIGQYKKTGKQSEKLLPLWDIYNLTIHTAVDPLRAHRRFLHYHHHAIKRLTLGGIFQLFAPFERGGLGFRPPEGLEFSLTSTQQRFAMLLEEEFFKDPGQHAKIALVSRKKTTQVCYYHNPNWKICPVIGPLEQNVLEKPRDTKVHLPPITEDTFEPEAIKMRVRHPKKCMLVDFKKHKFNKMAIRDLIVFPWKAYEERITKIRNSPPIVERNPGPLF
jgi:hypothetical protein